MLLLHRNDLVSLDRLVDELWAERPPTSARTIVKGYVSKLRRSLGEAGLNGLVTQAPGYVLKVEPADVDADCFETRLARGVEALRDARPRDATAQLGDALALWRGAPLVDFVYEPFAQRAIRRLEELRLVALEHRIEADLALGRHAHVVGELEALVDANPYREQLHSQLLLALYRSGRQAEALEHYTSMREWLLDELGVEPGPALKELQTSILRQDPALDLAADAGPAGPTAESAQEIVLSEEAGARTSPVTQERRRPATVVFCDLAGAAELGERLDSELVRRVLRTFSETAAAAFRRHGAQVEAFAGGTIMAAFGIPTAHEDDALRAVRAAIELREELRSLDDDLGTDTDAPLRPRIGLDSGEVVVGDASAEGTVTGPAVQLASHLQQSAVGDEIVLGARTWSLVRHATRVEARDEPAVTGSAVPSFRLVDVIAGAGARPVYFRTPLVGRTHELAQLENAFDRCVRERVCSLFTVLGPAGIGKSRLAAEFELALGGKAQVLVGSCPPYGEGVTFGPLREMLAQAVGDPLEERVLEALGGAPSAGSTAEAVAGLLGLNAWNGGPEAGFLAVRRLLAALAARRPLVLVFEDLHWAEPSLLDFIDNLLDQADEGPGLVLCLARRELVERRPGWAGGKPNATTISLDQLSEAESSRLATLVLADTLADDDRARAVALAEGNPLFLEQLLAFAAEGGPHNAERALPPTIEALLAARLDLLGPAERLVIERAAVLGPEFESATVAALVPDALQSSLRAHAAELVRKELIRPTGGGVDGAPAYRFRHVLIRDAAYRFMTKETRADLHERAADLLAGDDEDVELTDEVVGYHLEQAHRYRSELHQQAAAVEALGLRASERLEAAGRSALGRSHIRAASALLRRAADLVPPTDPRHTRLLADVAATQIDAGELTEARDTLAEAQATARAAGDSWGESRVRVEEHLLGFRGATTDTTAAATRVATEVIPVFTQLDDQRGLSRARRLQGASDWFEARMAAAAAAWERSAEHARRAGEEHERADVLTWVASSLWFGPAPVEPAIVRCEEIAAAVRWHLVSYAETLRALGGLHGFAGRFDAARSMFAESTSTFEELGLAVQAAPSHPEAIVEMLAGDCGAAERQLMRGYTTLEEIGETALRSTTAGLLARAVLAQGRVDDAERYAAESRALAHPEDLLTQIVWRGVQARVLQEHGRLDQAETLAREAVDLAATTDLVNFHADALVDLAAALDAAGRSEDSAAALDRAVGLYEQKGNVVAAARVSRGLDAYALV